MGTSEGLRWVLRLLVGAAAATVVAVGVPAGVAVAGPASHAAIAVVAPSLQPPPGGGPAGSATPSAGTSSAVSRARGAEQQERARANASRRAARLAESGRRARASWEAHGRPTTMVVVRPTSVDVVTEGRLTRRVPRQVGDLTLPMLDRYLPPSWLSITESSARLAAALVLTPGVTVDIGGATVTTLTLVGGTTLPEAASLYTGGGRLVLHGVTVSSSDRALHGVLPPTAGRPFIVVSSGGRLEAIDVTISDLGTPDTDRENRAGVQFTSGSSGSLVRTSLMRNSTGLRLGGAQDVHLEGVTIRESTGEGLVLSGDRGTAMSGIRVERNGGNGVRVTGTGIGRPVTGISTAGNGGFGIAAIGATSTRITGVATSDDEVGGLELSQSRDVTVSDSTVTDEPIGVFTHLGSTDVALDRMAIIGGRRGVEIEKTTKRLTMRATTISSARVAGVAIGGAEVELRDVVVRDSRSGVRVERGAQGVTAIGLRLSGGRDGVVTTPGTSRVVLHNLRAYDIENDAVRTFSPDTRILGGTITGATTGITAGAATTISGTTITLANAGIRVRSTSLVHAEDVDVDAVTVGIDVAPGSPFLLSGSRVHALEAVRGQLTQQGVNDLSLPPLNLLSAIGLPLVLLAIVLELVHGARQRRSGRNTNRWTPPALPPAARPSTEASTGFAHPNVSAAGEADENVKFAIDCRTGEDTISIGREMSTTTLQRLSTD